MIQKLKLGLSLSACLVSIASYEQLKIDTTKLSIPGPANQDTTKFSKSYIIRPACDVATTYWLGIYFNNDQMVRVENGLRYVVKYVGAGDVEK